MARQRPRTPPPPVCTSPAHKVAVYPRTTAVPAPTPIYKTTAHGTVVRKMYSLPTNQDLIRLKGFFADKFALGNKSVPSTPQQRQQKRRFVEYASPSSTPGSDPAQDDSSSDSDSDSADERSPLYKRRILRFERHQHPVSQPKPTRTSIYLRRDNNNNNNSRPSHSNPGTETQPCHHDSEHPVVDAIAQALPIPDTTTTTRRITRIDPLPVRPYQAFREAIQDESRAAAIVPSAHDGAPKAIITPDGELEWYGGSSCVDDGNGDAYPVPDEGRKLVAFARNRRLFIRIYLGPPKERVVVLDDEQGVEEEEEEEEEAGFADDEIDDEVDDEVVYDIDDEFGAEVNGEVDDYDDLPVMASDNGSVILDDAENDEGVLRGAYWPGKPMFRDVDWDKAAELSDPTEEEPAPEDVTADDGTVGRRGGNVTGPELGPMDRSTRSMTGETFVGEPQLPFEKVEPPFSFVPGWGPSKQGGDDPFIDSE